MGGRGRAKNSQNYSFSKRLGTNIKALSFGDVVRTGKGRKGALSSANYRADSYYAVIKHQHRLIYAEVSPKWKNFPYFLFLETDGSWQLLQDTRFDIFFIKL